MPHPVAQRGLSGLRADDYVTGPNNYTYTEESTLVMKLRRQLANEIALREAAERNAMQMHALLIAERVRRIREQKAGGLS